MTRTEKCRLLRLLIKSIAQQNHIVPLSSRCDYHCDCHSYCKKLGAELDWFFGEIDRVGLSNCSDAAKRLHEQHGLGNPENFEPNDLFFVEYKAVDEGLDEYIYEDAAESAAPLEEESQPTEWFDDTSDGSDDTEDSDTTDTPQE